MGVSCVIPNIAMSTCIPSTICRKSGLTSASRAGVGASETQSNISPPSMKGVTKNMSVSAPRNKNNENNKTTTKKNEIKICTHQVTKQANTKMTNISYDKITKNKKTAKPSVSQVASNEITKIYNSKTNRHDGTKKRDSRR